jgi:hypothetical protein
MQPGAGAFRTVEEKTEKGGFEKERKDALHGERGGDDAARKLRELRPVRAELKLHRDACDDAEQKIDPEDFGPEARRPVVAFIAFPERERLKTRIRGASPIVNCGKR